VKYLLSATTFLDKDTIQTVAAPLLTKTAFLRLSGPITFYRRDDALMFSNDYAAFTIP